MAFGRLLGHARREQPRSPEAARMLRGFVGVIVTNVLLVATIVVIMIAARP